MKKTVSILTILLLVAAVPAVGYALTAEEQRQIEEIKKNNEKAQKLMEEMKKQSEQALKDSQKQLEELKNKSANKPTTANKSVPATVKFKSSDYSKYIPKKDNWKITWIPKKIMDDNELKKYLKELHSKVEHAISKQSKSNAEQIIKETRNKYKTNTNIAIANATNGCWITKHPEEALYIMGVVCNIDPNDADNLNNYAAFITMSGAPEKAIPILNKLNSKYPNNSTILNNLGQAWFDLGDTQQAEKYLDGAIRAFAYHSQANYTKSIIEAAKGNQTEAVAAMKRSIKRGYSTNKEDMLTKLGGKLDGSDLNFPMPQDPLGLEKFVLPPYPQGVGDIKGLSKKWEEFRRQCSQKHDELYAQEMLLRKKMDAQHDIDMQAFMKNPQSITALKNVGAIMPPLYKKAMAKLLIEEDEVAGWDEAAYKKYKEKEAKDEQFKAEMDALEKQWEQGIRSCGSTNTYIKQANAKYETKNTEYIEELRKKINTEAYYLQYATPGGDDEVELMKVMQKERFIGALQALPVVLYDDVATSMSGCGSKAEEAKGGGKLADFYDLHCDNKISMDIGVVRWEFACNKATANLDIKVLSGSLKENLDTGGFKGTAEIGASIGKKVSLKEYGPLKAELGAEMKTAGFIEFDNSGVTDFGAKISAGIKTGASTDVIGKDILYGGDDIKYRTAGSSGTLIGAEARIGWNSGITTSGKGVLAGVL